MDVFDNHGHLTEQALLALIQEESLEELERLEIAEHLAFCDQCLQRYTELLTDDTLLTPSPVCREGLGRRVRQRLVRMFPSRYATAAAAVALGNQNQERTHPLEQAGQAMTEWASSWPQSFQDAFSGLTGFFDFLGGGPSTTQGGTHP